jgi:hypothetical protein
MPGTKGETGGRGLVGCAAAGFAVLFAAACGGGGGGSAPPVTTPALTASPPELRPGETVLLVPVFTRGAARLEPGIGAVVSGRGYRVGPFAGPRTFVLTITDGDDTTTVRLDVPLLYRERAAAAAPSAIARSEHGGTVLADGRVLLVGGASSGPLFWSNAEVVAAPGDQRPVGDLSTGRSRPVVVAMPDGSALAFGGQTNTASFEVATRVEQWRPEALAWFVRGNLLGNRSGHTGTALDATRVLVVGGMAPGAPPGDRDAEVFELGVGSRSPAGEAVHLRLLHSATTFVDAASGASRVLLAGGRHPVTDLLVRDAETFDPVTEQFVVGPPLLAPREFHEAVRLADGSVLLVGGIDDLAPVVACERFVPGEGRFVPAGELTVPRWRARAVLLGDGCVLLAGGVDRDGVATDLVEVWSPATGTWRPWAARLPAPRVGHTLHVLPDARVLLLGGDSGNGFPQPTAFVID